MMKKIASILVLCVGIAFSDLSAQTINWKCVENSNHLITASLGLDYSMSAGLGYARKIKSGTPLYLQLNLAIPSGKDKIDDFKTSLGGQLSLFKVGNFNSAVSLVGVYRRQQNEMVRLQNFGSDLKGIFGYYKEKGFLGAEVGFDKAIVTHFRHSTRYRNEVYPEVQDGWYDPSTGGNFYYGIQAGRSFKKGDLTLNLGKVISQDFETSPFLPFYLKVGFNCKW